jgi:hypothetical protein
MSQGYEENYTGRGFVVLLLTAPCTTHTSCLFVYLFVAEQLNYLGTNLTNRNFIRAEIKSRLKSGNACDHSVQDLLSYSLLSKTIEIKLYRTVILTLILFWCETWSLTLREEHRLSMF